MARIHFRETLTVPDVDDTLKTLDNISVTVYLAGTTTLAGTLYTSRTGGGTKTNPFTSDATGIADFWIDPGVYDIKFEDLAEVPERIPDQTFGWTSLSSDDARIPTQDENDALAGTSGTPGSANKYVTAGDPKVTADQAAGTASIRTIGTGALQAAAGNDTRLTDQRTPTDNSVTAAKVNTALKPSTGAAAGTEALRAIGSTASTVVAGNDARLTDQRTPLDNSVTSAKVVANGIALGDLETLVQEALFSAGDLKARAVSAVPSGWLLCDGTAVSRTTYAALFAAIGTTYGAGNGSTTFNVPDLRGRVPVGVDGTAARLTASDTLGASAGAEKHTLSTSELPAHSHGVTDPGHSHVDETSTAVNVPSGATYGVASVVGGALTGSSTTGISIQNAGSGSSHNNMQPYQIVNWIVKT